jgi:AAA15 family ATPase/GTPase
LLGVNESGKSNILKALNLKETTQEELSYGDDCEKNAESEEKEISVSYELSNFGIWDEVFVTCNIPKDLSKVIKLENRYTFNFHIFFQNGIRGKLGLPYLTGH